MTIPAILTGLLAPVVGGLAVMLWRMRETRSPVSARGILIPPLGMSTGFGMFLAPAMRIPLAWGLGAFLSGALVLAWPLVRTSRLERDGDAVMLRRSNGFMLILVALLALRLALRAWIGAALPPAQTAALFFVLAFGMIVRWRAGMYRDYRRLVPQEVVAKE